MRKLNEPGILMRGMLVVGIFALAGITFFTGIGWGLPDGRADDFLFGNRKPWTGEQVMKLAGAWESGNDRGADVAMHVRSSTQPIELNDTDAKRAEIVRRYRLYSNQPDEMITFRSLAGMKPGKLILDPRLYQYGGLWIYPVGLLLKAGAWMGVITLRSDLAYYLDHPGVFGRFYVVARLYAAGWGMVGVAVVLLIVREWGGSFLSGAGAAGIYSTMPVVINLAHEAKPHLPGVVLVMGCVFAGLRYARTGYRRWWILSGVLAGAAMGMVLTGYVAFAVLPVMVLLRPMGWRERIGVAGCAVLIGVLVYAITNPYVVIDLMGHRAVLESNVGNSQAFYRPGLSWAGLVGEGKMLVMAMSIGPAVIAMLGLLVMVKSRLKPGVVLAAPVIVGLIQFAILGDHKPAEYARFALLPCVFAGVLAAVLIAGLRFGEREKALLMACLIAGTFYFGIRYDINYVADGRIDSTRQYGARVLEAMERPGRVLALRADPAPYCLPAVDLFAWRMVLVPKGGNGPVRSGPDASVEVRPADEQVRLRVDAIPMGARPEPIHVSSPISWANKPFEIVVKTSEEKGN